MSKTKAGDWVFGKLADARDGQEVAVLEEMAVSREKQSQDYNLDLEPENFSVEKTNGSNTVFLKTGDGPIPLRDRAVEQLILSCNQNEEFGSRGLSSEFLLTTKPYIAQRIIEAHFPARLERKVRFWNGRGDDLSVRAIVSPKYQPIPAQRLLEMVPAFGPECRITAVQSSPEVLTAEIISLPSGFDLSRLGPAGPVPGDIVYPGWRIDLDDCGGGAAALYSFLWRLICNNGSSVVDQAFTNRAIHKGKASFKGFSLGEDNWKDLILQAMREIIQFPPQEEKMKKFARMAATIRPRLELVERCTTSIATSRWELVQNIGEEANRQSRWTDRLALNEWGGRILTDPSILEPVIVR